MNITANVFQIPITEITVHKIDNIEIDRQTDRPTDCYLTDCVTVKIYKQQSLTASVSEYGRDLHFTL